MGKAATRVWQTSVPEAGGVCVLGAQVAKQSLQAVPDDLKTSYLQIVYISDIYANIENSTIHRKC